MPPCAGSCSRDWLVHDLFRRFLVHSSTDVLAGNESRHASSEKEACREEMRLSGWCNSRRPSPAHPIHE